MGNPPETLLSVAGALEQLLRHFSPLERVFVPLSQAVGEVLAEPVAAALDLPPFPNSSMDGFAVRAADVQDAGRDRPVTLDVVADVPAGQVANHPVGAGEAARIMTGAPMPEGADAVVPVEDTDFNYRQPGLEAPKTVRIHRRTQQGENVRPSGQDVSRGEVVLQPGVRLRPQDVGFLAMLGVSRVPVRRRPRVAIFSTGDELLPVELPLTPGKIHDSNTYTLLALVRQAGGEGINLGIVPDQAQAVRDRLDQAVGQSVDLILSSAGVSVGAFDFVRTVVEQQGQLSFWRVNMRPGKPLAFGNYQSVPFIGLPGNPVSAYVGFEVFVRPALAKMAGLVGTQLSTAGRLRQIVRLAEAVDSDGRESYLRAQVMPSAGGLQAHLTGHQGSGNLRSLVQANALVVIPAGVKSLPAGSEVEAWFFSEENG